MRRRLLILTLLCSALAATALAPQARALGEIPEETRIPAPPIPMGLEWLNSPPLTMEQLRGKVVLLDFWEYTCINCIRTFPYLKAWHQKYADRGLVILGVHTPEFQFAKKHVNVANAAKQFGLKYPLVVDSDHKVWNAWGNRYWPAKYLIDAQGLVRYFHFGEGGYHETERQIQKWLRQANPDVELPSVGEAIRGTDREGARCYPVTPELYLGWERGGHEGTLGNSEGYRPGRIAAFKDPGDWVDGMVYLSGRWNNAREAVVSTRPNPKSADYIGIRYHALEVNSVIRPEPGKPVRVWVLHDGKPVAKKDRGEDIRYDARGHSYLLVNEPRMYRIIKNAAFGQHRLRLAPEGAGVGVYSFTFVSCEMPSGGAPPLSPPRPAP